jgi:N-methylhydantoinase A
MDVRYVGEVGELQVDVTAADLAAEGMAGVAALFHALHERTYTFSDPQSYCEVMALGVTAYGIREQRIEAIRSGHSGEATDGDRDRRAPAGRAVANARIAVRQAWFDRKSAHRTPVYAADRLPSNAAIDGPTIIEESTTTLVVPPEWRVEATRHYAWLLTRR